MEQGFFHKFAFDNKVLKTFVEFRIWWKRSNVVEFEFKLRHIPTYVLTVLFCFLIAVLII